MGKDIKAPCLRHLMTLYGSVLQPLSTKKAGVTHLSQLKEKPYHVWGADPGTVFYPLCKAALLAHGVTYEDVRAAGGVMETINYGQTFQAIQDGRLDVSVVSGPVPYRLLEQISKHPGFQLIGFDDQSIEKILKLLPGISSTVVEAGSYKDQKEDKLLPYVSNEFQIAAHVPEDLAYNIIKVLVEHHKEFHGLFAGSEEIVPERLLTNYEIPVHPGVARYYKEIGLGDRIKSIK